MEAGDKFEVNQVERPWKTARFERADRTAACVGEAYCTQVAPVLHCDCVTTGNRRLFEASSELLLTQLVSDQKLSKDQIGRLRRLLDEKTSKDKS